MLSPFPFAVVVDVVRELEREGIFSEMMHADDLVPTSETIEGLRNKFRKWKQWKMRAQPSKLVL